MNEDQIKHMADRFLGWRLPENFSPDAGIKFQPIYNEHLNPPSRREPVGTNLLDATQATAMVRHMVEGLSTAEAFVWLIEAPGARYIGTREIGHHPEFFWTTDDNKALRFTSRDAADGVMMAVRALAPDLFAFAVNLGDAQPTEHRWLDTAISTDGR